MLYINCICSIYNSDAESDDDNDDDDDDIEVAANSPWNRLVLFNGVVFLYAVCLVRRRNARRRR